jgi:hypothetical protein
MTPHDQQRFAKLVTAFIARGGFAPPFHLIAISQSNGSVIVSEHDDDGAEGSLPKPRRAVRATLWISERILRSLELSDAHHSLRS